MTYVYRDLKLRARAAVMRRRLRRSRLG